MTRTKAGFICGAFISVLMHANRCFCHVTCSQAHTSSSQEFIDISHEAEEEISKKRCGSSDLISANIFLLSIFGNPLRQPRSTHRPLIVFKSYSKSKPTRIHVVHEIETESKKKKKKFIDQYLIKVIHSFIHSSLLLILGETQRRRRETNK